MTWVREHGRMASWVTAAMLLAMTLGLVVIAFYPGAIYYDSAQTIGQARSGDITDWWTPAGSFVLKIWFEPGLGLPLVFLIQTSLFIGGVFLMTRHALSTVWAAIATVIIVCWPPTFAQLFSISRDVFFYDFTMLSLAALATAYRVPQGLVTKRRAWLGGALALAFCAMLIRQNGIVVVMVVAGAAFVLLGWAPSWARRSRGREVLAAAAVGAGVGIALFAVSQAGNRVTGVEKAHPEKLLYTYDLAAMSQELDENQFDKSWIRQPTGWSEPIYSMRSIDKRFSWTDAVTIFPPLAEAEPVAAEDRLSAATEASKLRSMWTTAARSHPFTYAKVRLRVNLSALGFFDRRAGGYPFAKDDGSALARLELGPPPHFTNRNRQARTLIGWFAGPKATVPLDLIFIYLLLGIGSAALLWRRWAGDRGLVVAVVAIELLTFVTFLFTTMANSYRFYAVIVPLSMVLVAWALAQFASDRQRIT